MLQQIMSVILIFINEHQIIIISLLLNYLNKFNILSWYCLFSPI